MSFLKGERPDAAVTAIEPRDAEHVGTQLTPSPTPQPDPSSTAAPLGEPVSFLVVYDDSGARCLGHLFIRGPAGIEAFDRNDHSLGYFSDFASAAGAVRGAAS